MRRALRRLYDRARLADPAYRFLFEAAPPDEAVALDCETTGLDPRRDEIVTVAAIPIRGTRILTSARFEAVALTARKSPPEAIKVHRILDADTRAGRPMAAIIPELLRFIGARPIVGYYTAFDVAMLDRYVERQIGIRLPNPVIDVSTLYYDRRYRHDWGHLTIDLSFARILRDLGIPALDQHDAFNDALMTAMMYLQLRDMAARGARIQRAGPT